MQWYNEFGWTEIVLISIFIAGYGFYLLRIYRIAGTLNTPYYNVFIKIFPRTLAFALLIIALLGPSFGEAKREVKSIGKDIMFCVDLSKSMDAFDIPPTRLEKIKFEMKRIVAAFNSDRLGVIIFSSEAFMQCPLTFDQNALNLFIETMNSSLVPGSGTDFAPPLRMAIDKMEQEDETTASQTKSKIIILISDGEDFGDDTREIVDNIKNTGIKLFTLGIGTEQGGQIRAGSGFKTDNQGNVVVTKLNPDKMISIANQTGGAYFEINETRNDVSRLINTINKIEGELRDARFVDVTANKYYYFLAVAIAILMLDALINVKTIRI